MREHIQTLGLLPPGAEGLGGPGDDPYDFKEGDIEYSFPSSKRLKGQGRDPGRRAKVRSVLSQILNPDPEPESYPYSVKHLLYCQSTSIILLM